MTDAVAFFPAPLSDDAVRMNAQCAEKLRAVNRLWLAGRAFKDVSDEKSFLHRAYTVRKRKMNHISAMVLARGTVEFGIHIQNFFLKWKELICPSLALLGVMGDYTAFRCAGQFPGESLSPYYKMFQTVQSLVMEPRNEFSPGFCQNELDVVVLKVYSELEGVINYVETIGKPRIIEPDERYYPFYAHHKTMRTEPDARDLEILSFVAEFMAFDLSAEQT